MYTTTIRCLDCDRAFRVPLDRGSILLDCDCGKELRFNPFEYSTLADLRGGSYYLPEFEHNLPKYSLQLVEAPEEVHTIFDTTEVRPFNTIPIPRRRLHRKNATGFAELHGLRVLVYMYFFDTLEIYKSTTSYILDSHDENTSKQLMEKLKYIVSLEHGEPDIVEPMGSANDYYWHLNYGLAYLSKSPQNQVLLQLSYKSHFKFASQIQLRLPSEEATQRITELNLEATELCGREEYEKCMEKCREVFELWRPSAGAMWMMGTALFHLGDFGQAEEYLQGAVERFPQMAPPHFTLGCLYLETNKIPLARHYLRTYLYICQQMDLETVEDNYEVAKKLLDQTEIK
jgi:hypothetical protein